MVMKYTGLRVLKRFMVCAVFASAVIGNFPAGGQEFSLTETEKAYQEACKVLKAGMEAFGGQTKLESIRNISFYYKGHHTAILQNTKPDFTQHYLEKTGQVIVDLQNDSILYEDKYERAGQYTSWHRYLIHSGTAVNINLRHRPNQFRNTSPDRIRERVYFMVPQFILLEAVKSRTTLRLLGVADLSGKKHHLLSFCTKDNRQHTLFIDSGTGLLTKLEVLEAFPVYGDRSREYLFFEYKKEGEFVFPHRRIAMLSGLLLEEWTYSEIAVNSSLAEKLFDLPDGAVENDDLAERAKKPAKITEISKDVYTLDNLLGSDNRILFVVFDDFVLVSGVPSGYSEDAIKRIRELVPDKPIRYVVPTHHDYSHGGGLRPYIAEGVTVVTTPGNRAFVEQMARAPHTLHPDRLARKPRSPDIEIIRNKARIFQDENHRLEVYDIGPTSHAEEILILYLPAEKILYQGDLLELDDDDPITSSTANEVTVEFLERLRKMKLDVQTIIGTEGRTASFEDLEKAVELRKQSQGE